MDYNFKIQNKKRGSHVDYNLKKKQNILKIVSVEHFAHLEPLKQLS